MGAQGRGAEVEENEGRPVAAHQNEGMGPPSVRRGKTGRGSVGQGLLEGEGAHNALPQGLEGGGPGEGPEIRRPRGQGEHLEIHGPPQGSQFRFEAGAEWRDLARLLEP